MTHRRRPALDHGQDHAGGSTGASVSLFVGPVQALKQRLPPVLEPARLESLGRPRLIALVRRPLWSLPLRSRPATAPTRVLLVEQPLSLLPVFDFGVPAAVLRRRRDVRIPTAASPELMRATRDRTMCFDPRFHRRLQCLVNRELTQPGHFLQPLPDWVGDLNGPLGHSVSRRPRLVNFLMTCRPAAPPTTDCPDDGNTLGLRFPPLARFDGPHPPSRSTPAPAYRDFVLPSCSTGDSGGTAAALRGHCLRKITTGAVREHHRDHRFTFPRHGGRTPPSSSDPRPPSSSGTGFCRMASGASAHRPHNVAPRRTAGDPHCAHRSRFVSGAGRGRTTSPSAPRGGFSRPRRGLSAAKSTTDS